MAEPATEYRLEDQQDYYPDSPEFRSPFDSFFSSQRPMFSLASRVWNPPTDVYETAEAVVIKMEVAGLAPTEFQISVERGHLIVRGGREDANPPSQTCYHHVELRYGRFERAFLLPERIDGDGIVARYDRGFLTIHVPKTAAPPKPRHVRVKIEE